MTWQSETRAWAVAAAAVFCLGSIGYKVSLMPDIPALGPTLSQVDATLSNVNRATATWSQASAQQVRSIGDIERDLRAELWHIDRLTQEGSQTLQAAQGAIGTAQEQLTHVAPLLDATQRTVSAAQPAIEHITTDADTLTAQGGAAVGQTTEDLKDLQEMERLATQSERDATADFATARRGFFYRLFRKLF